MITIEVNDKSWDIPSNVNELTLANYIDIINNESDDGVDFLKKVYGIPKGQLRKIPKIELNHFMIQYVGMIADVNTSHAKAKELADNWKEKGFESVEIDGIEYDVPEDIMQKPYGHWEDCNMLMERFQDKEHEFFPYFIAIWLMDYTPETLEDLMHKAKTLDLYTAFCLVAFFLTSERELLKSFSLNFPQSIIVNSYKQVLTNLIGVGATSMASQPSQKDDNG